MDKVSSFFALKAEWSTASGVRRQEIDRELSALMDSLSADELDVLAVGIHDNFARLKQEMAEIAHLNKTLHDGDK